MERNLSRKWIPFCPSRYAQVDQYSFPEKDTTERHPQDGLSHAIYSCNGWISYTLPLTMWPKVNQIHPQIAQSEVPHFGARDPYMRRQIELMEEDRKQKRLEGFYSQGAEYNPYDHLPLLK